MRLSLIVSFLLPAVAPAAQSNTDLTGRAEAVITEPFTMINGVRELPGQQAVVTDQFERRVFLVDFKTGTRREIGRQGDGPAEYRFPMAPMAAGAGRTMIFDATLRRILVIGTDGSFDQSLTPPSNAVPGGLLSARGVDAKGRVYFEGNSFNSETGRFTDSVAVLRWSPADNVTETIGKVWSGGRVMIDRGGMSASVARTALPFPHVDAWVPLPDGRVVIARQEPHQILVLEDGAAARPGAIIAHTPIPVTAAERSAYRERHQSARMTAAGGGESRRAPPVGDAEFPPNMPAFMAASVIGSPSGTVWIGRSHRANDRTWRYDLFDAQGRAAGSATLNASSRVVGFGDGVVYIARTNPDDDLVYLERHRLR